MKNGYKILSISGLLFLVLLLSNCKLIFYGIGQGLGQMNIIINAKPIDKVLNDPDVSDTLKQKLLLVQSIKKYAEDTLGLNPSKNYNTLYDQHGQDILWVVTAAPKYSVQPYMWKFPVVGEVPYKGYFKLKKAQKEALKMKEDGYDVHIGTVTAWSTLGFFKDPILSGMLDRSEGMIARLIIHELTHSTLFVKGNSEFNENLATFVGTWGAKQYLIDKYGKNSKEYKDYLGELNDIELFSNYVLQGAKQLDRLYHGFSSETEQEKEKLKAQMIKQIVANIDTVQFYNEHNFSRFKEPDNLPGNAFFAGYITYHKQQNELEKEFVEKFKRNFKEYLNFLKGKYKK
jgi:predicted aminopeptidase